MDYTVEIYKLDKRVKNGKKLVSKTDYTNTDLNTVEVANPQGPRYVVMIHETYVTRRNLMTGNNVKERYDTPWCSSVASESYWSN